MTERVNNNPNGSTTPSEYDVIYARITTQRSDTPIDITNLINYIEIFESVYSPFLTVNVNITDTFSLNNFLPLVGEEFLELDVRGPDGKTGIIGQGFSIYKVSERMAIGDKAFAYTLHCVSGPAVVDMNIKLSQAFTGLPSDIVKNSLCTKNLSIAKPVYAHPSKNIVSYISNYWTPVQNIKYLCDRAVSSDTNSPSYLFYETKKAFNFVTLDALVRQDPAWQYFYSVNTHIGDNSSQQSIIHNLYVDENFNYIDRLMSGAYGNRSITVDPFKKKYQYAYYDFLESYNKFSRLNELPFNSSDAVRRPNSVLRTREVPSMAFGSMTDEFNVEWYRQRLTELAVITSQQIHFDASGRFNIYAGSVVDVVIPITQMPTSESKENDFSKTIDKTLSGRYLVTGLKHTLGRTRHTISIEASKDSLVKAVSK